MKKTISIILLLLFVCVAFAGCGQQTVIPEAKIRWSAAATETLTYDVRLANDYEMAYINYYTRSKNGDNYVYTSNLDQIAPSSVYNGSYATIVTATEGKQNFYTMTTALTYIETYDEDAFAKAGVKDATELEKRLGELAAEEATKAAAQQDYAKILTRLEDGTFEVAVEVRTEVTFSGTNLLPENSKRTVRSAYVGKSGCDVNDFETTVFYNYSNSKPRVVIESTLRNENTSLKLKKTQNVKTYDNEQLFLMMRCLDKEALFSNSTTAINIVEGSFNNTATTVRIYASASLKELEEFKIGAIWSGDYDASKNPSSDLIDEFNDKNQLCRYLNDGTNFVDLRGNGINVKSRDVFVLYVAPVSGLNMMAIFDDEESITVGRKQRLVRAQQGYLVFDLSETSRNALDA